MKKALREKIRLQRKSLGKDFIKTNSELIKTKLFQTDEYKKAKSILFYVSFENEVDTFDMIKEALLEKTVAVPIVQEDNIVASVIKDFSNLDSENNYEIKEPSVINNIENIDLVIVPGLAFDKYGNRVGFGKGYYDKFLKGHKTIALCFDFQIFDKVPAEDHDVPINIILSEKQILKPTSL